MTSQLTDLNAAITALNDKRREFAPEYNAGRLYGAHGESIDRATRAYSLITRQIDALIELRATMRRDA